MSTSSCLVAATLALTGTALLAREGHSFLRHGDRWNIIGDSITNNGTYIRMMRRVIYHFRPDAEIEINGIAANGVASDYDFRARSKNPTVVSIMLGTNDVIHQGYEPMPADAILARYRERTTKSVRDYQEQGAVVLLLSSPLTDEVYSRSWWELRHTNAVISQFPRVLKEIAAETGAVYIPVQEELEAYRQYLDDTWGIVRPLYPDGVHPNGWAQYQIARTLWRHLNVRGALGDADTPRRLATPPEPTSVSITVDGKFHRAGEPLVLRLTAPEPTEVALGWSWRQQRGTATLTATPDGTAWTVPVEDLDVPVARSEDLLVDLAVGDQRSLYILDVTGTRVWHLGDDGSVGGPLPYDEPEKHGTWRIAKRDGGLLVSGTVSDEDLQATGRTYGPRDGVQIMLDLRQDERFADLSYDEDVHLVCVNVQDKPVWGVGIVPIWGRGMPFAAYANARPTATGYDWSLFVSQGFKDRDEAFDVEQSDYIGFNIDIVDQDHGAEGKRELAWIQYIKPQYSVQTFPVFMHIIDLKNQLPGDRTMVLNLWGF